MKALRAQWPSEPTEATPRIVCDVELGLTFAATMGEAPAALPTLLSGYPFPVGALTDWQDSETCMAGAAKQYLLPYRNPNVWRKDIARYRSLTERLRAFDVAADLSVATPKPVSVASERKHIYAEALRRPVPHRAKTVRWAEAGEYEFLNRRRWSSVVIPPELVFPPPVGHPLNSTTTRSKRERWTIPWRELEETAAWMDEEGIRRGLDSAAWAKRLGRVRPAIIDPAALDGLKPANEIVLDGLENFVGMVSSGKSTLMDILAVWAARNGKRITLVVPDVMNALNRAQTFVALGLTAAPMLGGSNRLRHTNRLHRAMASNHPLIPLPLAHEGFRWLSTVCPLDGLRDTSRPLEPGMQPCLRLIPRSDDENDVGATSDGNAEHEACPMYSVCPYHQAQRDLIEAAIWIATPASLVYTRVAPQLCEERIRFAELVYRRSDLVIVDEADQVQVQLDHIFNPSQTLVSSRQDAWLGRLEKRVVDQLNQEGRSQLADESVDTWCQGHDLAQSATDRIYARLLRSNALRLWVEKGNYFTDLNLLYQIARTLSGIPEGQDTTGDPEFERIIELFEAFAEDPLNERGENALAEIALQLVTLSDEGRARRRLRNWLGTHKAPSATFPDALLSSLTEQLEFALLVSVLHDRLAKLLREWRQVEAPLGLEETGSILFHKPPEDYASLLPEPPMGQVLAFQYVRTDPEPDKAGDLRFFRCTGVGRWLLLHFPTLFAADGIAGPHVLLLSGTSWAGTSPSYHVQAPVTGVLRAAEEDVEAISKSTFEFFPMLDANQRAITVSGRSGSDRISALQEVLNQLSRSNGFGGASLLEQERNRLPEDRRRLLLLVGSYEEAKLAYHYLCKRRPEWAGEMRHLVADDVAFEAEWSGAGERPDLQRGLVQHLASLGAWILIAPLLAVERGHNILTEDGQKAAIGSAFFLVRPHPRPDDIGYAIHSINHWAVERYKDLSWLINALPEESRSMPGVTEIGNAFRRQAFSRWRALLRLPMRYSTLPEEERQAVTWSHLVSLWQVIGRLVRGGSEARIFFCDAAFAPRTAGTAGEEGDVGASSLLVGMQQVLAPYFADSCPLTDEATQAQAPLVRTLYGPFYTALEKIGGITIARTI
jgi:hypothetical protein